MRFQLPEWIDKQRRAIASETELEYQAREAIRMCVFISLYIVALAGTVAIVPGFVPYLLIYLWPMFVVIPLA